MAVQDILNYNYKQDFTLSVINFETACVVNKPEQIKDYSLYWIQEGNGSYNIDFKTYTFTGDVLFFLSPGQVFLVDSEKIKTAYKLTFNSDFYCIQTHDKEIACNGVLFNNIYESPLVTPNSKETKRLNSLIQLLIEELETPNTAQHDMLQAYLKQFIVNAVRIKKSKSEIKTDTETRLFKDFSVLVEQNFKTLHTVTDYANRLGLSPKSLTKHFSKINMDTPSDFIKNRIILEAKRLLIYSNDSVKTIAYSLGFNDSAYFTRFFKKATQLSPLQFKKNHRS